MRSLRIFFSAGSSGQLVIASRESQYKVLHFHHGGLDKLSEIFDDWKFLALPTSKVTGKIYMKNFTSMCSQSHCSARYIKQEQFIY